MKAEGEEQLIQRCRRGDEEAWKEVFSTHYEPVYRFVFQQSKDFTPQDVEEICQETFLAAIQNIWNFKSRSGLQTWLFRIAMNRGRDWIARQRAAKRGGGIRPLPLEVPPPRGVRRREPADPAPPPDEAAAEVDDFTLVRDALDRLGGPCRDLIELHYFADVPVLDLCLEFEMSVKSMRTRLRKCLRRLEDLLPERFRETRAASRSADSV